MTREIKFRAWDKIRKERYWKSNPNWLLWYWFGLFWECMLVEQLPLDYIINLDITQSTGENDKNWKEIYGGDIVKDCRWNIHIVEYKQWIYWSLYDYDVYIWDDSEVIGNIYENKDLIPN